MKETILDIMEEILRMNREDMMEKLDSKDAWDSLQRVEVIFALEDEFGFQFSEDELTAMTTPRALLEAVERKG